MKKKSLTRPPTGAAKAIKEVLAKLTDEELEKARPPLIRELVRQSGFTTTLKASHITARVKTERENRKTTVAQFNARMLAVVELVDEYGSVEKVADAVDKVRKLHQLCGGWHGLEGILQIVAKIQTLP